MRSSSLAFGLLLLFVTPALYSQKNGLTNNGRIMGTVINSDGEPISHASICTSIHSRSSSSTSCGSAQTDEIGRFELEHLPIGEIGIFAEKPEVGYWIEDWTEDRKLIQTVSLNSQEPLAHVVLKVGPRPGELTIVVRDRVTGKPVESNQIRTTQGSHTFINENSSTTTVRVRPDSEVMVQISAPGYKTWYYIDPDDPSQPVLRLRPGENKTVDAYLDPKPPGVSNER
jgi:hypothetical protein